MKKLLAVLIAGCMASVGAHGAQTQGQDMREMAAQAASSKQEQTHRGVGVVKAIDAAKGTVTIAHEPVASLKWPAMVMPFSIAPVLAKNIQVGQKVNFEFTAKDMNGTVTKISVAK